jgi:hypothetical protein
MFKQLCLIWVCSGLMVLIAMGDDRKTDLSKSALDANTNSAPARASTSGTVTKDYAVQAGGTLHFTFPKAWNDYPRQFKQKDDSMLQLIQFLPSDLTNIAVVVEYEPLSEDKLRNVDLKKLLTETGRLELPDSIEKSVEIRDLKGAQVEWAYFTLTDKHLLLALPQPGEFKYLAQGFAKLPGLLLKFRIASNRFDSEAKQAAFEMIKTASFTARQ